MTATDPNGYPLQYLWRSTDGHIHNVNSPTTSWTLPNGPGLHFAYVLVSNGTGGYIERRVAVSTDTIGAPIQWGDPVRYRAPSAPAAVGEVYRSFLSGGSQLLNSFGEIANMADGQVFAQDVNNTYRDPAYGVAKTNIRGEYTLSNNLPIAATDAVNLYCADPLGNFGGCGGYANTANQEVIYPDYLVNFDVTPGQAVTDYIDRSNYDGASPNYQLVAGTALMADNTPCGTVNEFFGLTSTGTATLLDTTGAPIHGTRVRMSNLGAYTFNYNPTAASILVQCEHAAPQTVTITAAGDMGTVFFPATGAPSIPDTAGMTATFNGNSVGLFLPPPTGLPSDIVSDPERFLSYKGIDSRQDACAYYQAIGAARGCDEDGNLVSPISFDDWMRATKMGKYATAGGPTEYVANYINKADLNLARSHHSISYGPNQTAAYVCNHLGPKIPVGQLDPPQSAIDAVVATNLVGGANLVACVAMDFSISPGVNGGQPFVRFLIFGPSGQLLPSVNLDGRREKFVPGTCVVCHGSDHYAGHYIARNNANIGAHFLPYDAGNFEFSSVAGLTECDQSESIYRLNQNVLAVIPTVAEQELIGNWYANNGAAIAALGCTQPIVHALDKTYIPDSWKNQTDVAPAVANNFYTYVIARSCRGCHVAMVEGYNWDHYVNLNTTEYRYTGLYDFTATISCGGSNDKFRSFSMPNSLVTFNRYWQSNLLGSTDLSLIGLGTPPDQVGFTNAFLEAEGGGYTGNDVALNCVL